jgi:hypothetical protein
MNGISLKDLRWFSTFNDEFLVSESVSIWQAVLFMLPYFDDDASVSYFDDIQRMEVEVYEDLIEKLDKEGQLLLRDDASLNYTHSYTELDDMGNLLLTEEQIDEILPELNRSRMLVIGQIEEADNIYQQLKIEIRKSRDKRPTKIELIEDTLRNDFERVLIKRTSLEAVFPRDIEFNKDDTKSEKGEFVAWNKITIEIDYRGKKSDTKDCTSDKSAPHIVFKTGRRILCQGTPKELSFQGKKRTKPTKSFEILKDFSNPHYERKYSYKIKTYRKSIADLRKVLKGLLGIADRKDKAANPFYQKYNIKPYEPKFTVKFLEEESANNYLDYEERFHSKHQSYEDDFIGDMSEDNEDGVTGYTPDHDEDNDIFQ